MKDHIIIKTENDLIDYVEAEGGFLKKNPLTVFDNETTGLRIDMQLLGISLFNRVVPPAYISVQNRYMKGVPLEAAREILNPIFRKMRALAHNGKYDLWVFKLFGFEDPIMENDTAMMIHAFDPELLKKLETRVKLDLGIDKPTYEQIIGKKWDKIDWVADTRSGLITVENMGKYACEDVYYTYEIYDHYLPLLEKEDLMKVLDKIEVPLIYVLRDMKHRGINIDLPKLQELDDRIVPAINNSLQNIYECAGVEFNVNSPKQLGEVLFDKMGIVSSRETKTGNRSTDKHALKMMAAQGHEIADHLLDYSGIKTLHNSFIKAIPKLVDADGRLRCEFNSDGARTGRMSSNSPNLQNQPNNKEFPVRAAFIPTPGYKLIVADWSQIELRVMAHAAKDKALIQAFVDDLDIHGFVAESLGITRSQAKVINFAVLYGMGAASLALSLKVSQREAQKIIDGYSKSYPGFATWKKGVEQFAQHHGYVKNIFGRVRRLEAARHRYSGGAFGAAMRQSANTIIQGSAADLLKIGGVKVAEAIREKKLDMHQLLYVHDEFVTEAKEHVPGRLYHLEECYDTLKHVMENCVSLRAPIKADGKVLNNWADMKDDSFISLLEAGAKTHETFQPLDLFILGIL